MRIPIQRFLAPCAWAAVLAGTALAPGAASAQIEAPREAPREVPDGQRAFCMIGRPVESCRTFLIAEGNVYAPAVGTTYPRRGYGAEGIARKKHLAPHVAWEVGAMRNVGPREAVGATLLVGGDANGERVALKGRYRRWNGRRAALDVAAGVLFARRAEPYLNPEQPGNIHVPVAGLTGDVTLGLTDWVGASVRGDLLVDQDGDRAAALYGGLKLGTRPAAVATAAPLLFAVILGALYAGSGG